MNRILRNRKEATKSVLEDTRKIADLYKELTKYDPTHIASDRIKTEINRLTINSHAITIDLLLNRIVLIYILLGILFGTLILSFFVKPKINLEFTLSIAVIGTLAISLGTIMTIILKHFLSKEDREVKRKRDLAEIDWLKSQTKK